MGVGHCHRCGSNVVLYVEGGGMMNKVEEAMASYWGERCSDHEAECPTCQAWGEYDNLAASGFGRLFNAQELEGLPWLQVKLIKESAIPWSNNGWLIPYKK